MYIWMYRLDNVQTHRWIDRKYQAFCQHLEMLTRIAVTCAKFSEIREQKFEHIFVTISVVSSENAVRMEIV
jgi:hypothetical protein